MDDTVHVQDQSVARGSPEGQADWVNGAAALEHLTGPCRGSTSWLGDSVMDITFGPDMRIVVGPAKVGAQDGSVLARLHRSSKTYEIESVGDHPIWINRTRLTAQALKPGDVIEFGESGPISRFCLYGDDDPSTKSVSEIFRDAVAYVRVSRKPLGKRTWRAVCDVVRSLLQETTRLYRIGIVLAIFILGVVVYQQSRLDRLLQQQIESGSQQMESFAGALSRARDEALTPGDIQALRDQLMTASDRLAELERRSEASATVIENTIASVMFLQGSYGFREADGDRMLRHAVNEEGQPFLTTQGQPLLTLSGEGPVAERQFTGTGFLVDPGVVVTNRHVARPWESDASSEALAGRGLDPVMIRFIAYIPNRDEPGAVELVRVSEEFDLAVLRVSQGAEGLPMLRLAEEPPARGDEVIVMGYPTGLRSMLAQAGAEFLEELQADADTGFWSVAARLSENGLISPLASRGIVGQVSQATLVYDAETTHGGSGGPVLDVDGAVVGVNTAILPEFGGSNFGVPVARVRALLSEAGL